MRFIKSLMHDKRGSTAVEYGIILAVLSMVMIASFGTVTGALTNMFGMIQTHIEGQTPVN